MTKLQFLTGTMARLRKEKQPPLTRYAVCLAIAQFGDAGATIAELESILCDGRMGGTIDGIATRPVPLIRIQAATSIKNPKRYFLTPAGVGLVAQLLNPEPETAKRA
jgi:hypothetical protein